MRQLKLYFKMTITYSTPQNLNVCYSTLRYDFQSLGALFSNFNMNVAEQLWMNGEFHWKTIGYIIGRENILEIACGDQVILNFWLRTPGCVNNDHQCVYVKATLFRGDTRRSSSPLTVDIGFTYWVRVDFWVIKANIGSSSHYIRYIIPQRWSTFSLNMVLVWGNTEKAIYLYSLVLRYTSRW